MKFKKHQLIALAISTISTGILISCAKNNDEQTSDIKESVQTETTEQTPTSADTSNTNTSNTKSANTNSSENTAKTQEHSTAIKAVAIATEDSQELLTHISTNIIIPTYENVMNKSRSLETTAKKYCQDGSLSTEDMKTIRDEWLAVASAWAQAEVINFGSATENMNNLYINYFPDHRNLVHRSVTQLIKDNPNMDTAQFINQSAVVQGIPAIEDLLYTNEELNQAQCNFLLSASTELTRRLSIINEDWQKNYATLLDTSDPIVGMNQWFNSLLSLIETLKSTGIDRPLGLTKHPKGHVPAYKAQQSNAIIRAKLTILQTSLLDPKLAAISNSDDINKITTEMQQTLNDIFTLLEAMPADISDAEKTQQQNLFDNLTTLTKQIKRKLMPLLGIQIGFNSTDGD